MGEGRLRPARRDRRQAGTYGAGEHSSQYGLPKGTRRCVYEPVCERTEQGSGQGQACVSTPGQNLPPTIFHFPIMCSRRIF